MTLLIACILIYHFDMSGGWYVASAVLWVVQLIAVDKVIRDNVKAASCRYSAE